MVFQMCRGGGCRNGQHSQIEQPEHQAAHADVEEEQIEVEIEIELQA